MASGKRPRTWGDGIMDDVWEWAAEASAESGCLLQISLYPTRRKTIWKVQVRLVEVVDGRPAGIRLQHAVEWPDATYAGLPWTILQALSHLAVRAEEDALQRSEAPA